MLEQQQVAVDLPQKYLSWEAEDGTVYRGYNSAEYVAARAGIVPGSDALAALRMGSAAVARQASGNAAALREGKEPVSGEGYLVERKSGATVAGAIGR